MDMYGYTAPEFLRIDDFLDLSNDQIFSSSAATDSDHHHLPNSSHYHNNSSSTSSAADTVMNMQFPNSNSTDFASNLCVPVSTNHFKFIILYIQIVYYFNDNNVNNNNK